MGKRPGGELATRPLHFILMADCSGSMQADGKIQALNQAIREALPHMREAAAENPRAQVLVRAIRFSDQADWHLPTPTPVDEFKWTDLRAGGKTSLGKALRLVTTQLRIPPMESRALPPVLVLISDGQPTDDYAAALHDLFKEPWGQRSVRIAIGIGGDADFGVLGQFIGNPSIKPLPANNADSLTRYIKWASTAVLKAASSPTRRPQDPAGQEPLSVVLPQLPSTPPAGSSEPNVW
ncbi:MAG: VWA domain-containing protein [Candidatus Riflebacteria bacterium]|nr:VWA domain-containing protein [Candidatus Riflebacteria bacterium]